LFTRLSGSRSRPTAAQKNLATSGIEPGTPSNVKVEFFTFMEALLVESNATEKEHKGIAKYG
jgi:hypothetical protein